MARLQDQMSEMEQLYTYCPSSQQMRLGSYLSNDKTCQVQEQLRVTLEKMLQALHQNNMNRQ